MDARNPHLLQIVSVYWFHQVLQEEPAPLIHRNGVPNDADAGIVGGERKPCRVPYPPDGRDGIPQTDKMDREPAAAIGCRPRQRPSEPVPTLPITNSHYLLTFPQLTQHTL